MRSGVISVMLHPVQRLRRLGIQPPIVRYLYYTTLYLVDGCYKSQTNVGQFSLVAPGFRKATPWVRTVVKFRPELCDFQYRRTSRDVRVTGSSAFYLSPEPTWFGAFANGRTRVSQNTINRSVTEARAKLAGTKVDLGAELAELKSTARTIADLAVRLIEAVRAARRGDWPGVALALDLDRPGQAARDWLAYQYGIVPLMSSIFDGVELIRKGFKGKDLLFCVHRTVSGRVDASECFSISSSVKGYTLTGEFRESAKTTLWAKVTNELLSGSNQLGLINPLSVAWEVMTFSFILDWLVPVGTFLESLTAAAGLEFVDGHTVTRMEGKASVRVNTLSAALAGTEKGKLPSAFVQVFGMERIVYNGFPLPMLYWRNPLTDEHVANACALIAANSPRR